MKTQTAETFTREQVIEDVLRMLSHQRFANWYSGDGDFARWIKGGSYAPTDENIRDQLKMHLWPGRR